MQIINLLATLFFLFIQSGCTYSAKIQESSLAGSAFYGQRDSKGITLIDNRETLLISAFKVGGYKGSIDAREAFFNATKSMLNTLYKKVDIAKSPKPENPLYAVASYDTQLPDPGPVTTLITNEVKVQIFETETKRLLNTYTSKNEGRASVNVGLGFLTGYTLFVLSPITVPIITKEFGAQGEKAIESNLNTGLNAIRENIAKNP